jgi:hypothetical protein
MKSKLLLYTMEGEIAEHDREFGARIAAKRATREQARAQAKPELMGAKAAIASLNVTWQDVAAARLPEGLGRQLVPIG